MDATKPSLSEAMYWIGVDIDAGERAIFTHHLHEHRTALREAYGRGATYRRHLERFFEAIDRLAARAPTDLRAARFRWGFGLTNAELERRMSWLAFVGVQAREELGEHGCPHCARTDATPRDRPRSPEVPEYDSRQEFLRGEMRNE